MIGEIIRMERKLKNWTQQDLANKTNIKQPVIARYEKGQHPSAKNLNAIAKALKLPVEHFTLPRKRDSTGRDSFNEFEFDAKLSELKECPVTYKMALLPLIDLVLNVNRANTSQSEGQ